MILVMVVVLVIVIVKMFPKPSIPIVVACNGSFGWIGTPHSTVKVTVKRSWRRVNREPLGGVKVSANERGAGIGLRVRQ